jgi:hypothetical protein
VISEERMRCRSCTIQPDSVSAVLLRLPLRLDKPLLAALLSMKPETFSRARPQQFVCAACSATGICRPEEAARQIPTLPQDAARSTSAG